MKTTGGKGAAAGPGTEQKPSKAGRGKGRPFSPGVSGNPGGRPKVADEFKARCRRILDETVIDAWADEIKMRPREIITPAGPFEMECRGPHWVKASELIAGYAIGKPAQRTELTGADGGPVNVRDVSELSDADLEHIAKGDK